MRHLPLLTLVVIGSHAAMTHAESLAVAATTPTNPVSLVDGLESVPAPVERGESKSKPGLGQAGIVTLDPELGPRIVGHPAAAVGARRRARGHRAGYGPPGGLNTAARGLRLRAGLEAFAARGRDRDGGHH